MRTNRTTLYDHSVAGILAGLTHGILLDANQRAQGENTRARALTGRSPRRSWLDRLDNWFWKQEMKRREAYLAQSSDIFDLEQRMRSLDQAGN
jgi:hypothetical protein